VSARSGAGTPATTGAGPDADHGSRSAPSLVSHVKATHGPELEASLERLVEPFGGWSAIVHPGERVAVKINLLRAAPPEKAVTTHPETLGCVLRALKGAGAEPFVADSPGGPNGPAKVARAYKLSGIADVCAAESVQIVDVEDDRTMLDAPEGRLYRSFPIGKAFVDADAVIQVGVLKTHQLMRLTGGVKLTYGVIPGLAKAHLHVKAQRREDFADMLLDLHLAVRPRFTIIDAIIAMEGQGPGSGTPRELDSLFAARDCLALDAALADRTAHERRHVHTIAASARRGLLDPDDPYRLAGDPIEPERTFKPVRRDMQELLPPSLHRLARNLITARPRLVDADACIVCNECAAICGTRAIAMEPLPDFDDTACVRCFACTEVCPTAAIDNTSPLLVRLVSRGR
jgi:uncharacterized protein (DUF362 family)/NAD-dependent dihydropyrimidine dehydrogenase PreA subunit